MRGLVVSFRAMLAAPERAVAAGPDSGRLNRAQSERDHAYHSPAALGRMQFAAGSMGPKVEAACRFASATGKRAAIGALADLGKIITGEADMSVSGKESGIVYAG